MFGARQRPLLVLEDRLLALRLSLNTPVLATAEFSSGPARAAIFAHSEGGERRFCVVVCAVRGGTPVVYELEAEVPDDTDGWSVALDTALSFGESMGFLFDDELVVDRSSATLHRAVTLLRGLLTPGEAAAAATASIGAGDELAEILLEDELDALAPEGESEGADATGPLEPPAFAPGIALSKFRSAPPQPAQPQPTALPQRAAELVRAAEAAAAPAVRGGATLGRVRPLRVRADGDAAPRPDPLLRLLADF